MICQEFDTRLRALMLRRSSNRLLYPPISRLPPLLRLFVSSRVAHVEAEWRRDMFATAVRWMAKKPKPKMKAIDPPTPPELTQTITRTIFDVVKEHGPLTIADTWDHIKVLFSGSLDRKSISFTRLMREREVNYTIH